MDLYAVFFTVLGYLSGSVLYARVMGHLFQAEGIVENSKDHNPGAFNAFCCGGVWCGLTTLLCDILKGLLPVFFYLKCVPCPSSLGLALVMAAPVLGHLFPVFYQFNGGKGIAVTFGITLALLSCSPVFLIFAGSFLVLSTLVRVESHYYRTLAAYMSTLAVLLFTRAPAGVLLGFTLLSAGVFVKMHRSREEKGERKVSFLWMH